MKWLGLLSIALLILACQAWNTPSTVLAIDTPKGFPEVEHPEGNEHSLARWSLGKKLFYDPIMSRDNSISCASCHSPELAFSDKMALSVGVDGARGTQNAPTLSNVAYNPYLTRAGGVPTLEMQILVPIQEHNEFDNNVLVIAERMAADSDYVAMSRRAYDRAPDPFVITRALACFERSLISGNSRYDQEVVQGKSDILTEEERAGMTLFFSDRSQCSSCHGGFNFTDYRFANNGLYTQYPDSGRYRLTLEEEDRALFKVPTLRNLSFTAPYMHDGSLASLEQVIEHYSTGIQPHKNLSENLSPLGFDAQEKKHLLAFLRSLDDYSFVTDERFKKRSRYEN